MWSSLLTMSFMQFLDPLCGGGRVCLSRRHPGGGFLEGVFGGAGVEEDGGPFGEAAAEDAAGFLFAGFLGGDGAVVEGHLLAGVVSDSEDEEAEVHQDGRQWGQIYIFDNSKVREIGVRFFRSVLLVAFIRSHLVGLTTGGRCLNGKSVLQERLEKALSSFSRSAKP